MYAQYSIMTIVQTFALTWQETKQFLVWDKEGEEDVVDHVTTQLFEAADRDESPEAKRSEKKRGRSRDRKTARKTKTKKRKQTKKNSSSSSSRSSSAKSSSSSSSSAPSSKSSHKACHPMH